MEEIPISEFKAKCLAVLERVRRTRRGVRVTRFGEPVAEVVPTSVADAPRSWLGSMAGRGRIRGDLTAPAGAADDWDALA